MVFDDIAHQPIDSTPQVSDGVQYAGSVDVRFQFLPEYFQLRENTSHANEELRFLSIGVRHMILSSPRTKLSAHEIVELPGASPAHSAA